jgi:hypothetical protein
MSEYIGYLKVAGLCSGQWAVEHDMGTAAQTGLAIAAGSNHCVMAAFDQMGMLLEVVC